MRKNEALAKWRAGGQTVGGWLSLPNTHTAEMMAQAGFDWICIDLQHGLIDYSDLVRMLPAVSTGPATPLARVSGNNPSEIMKVLDAGVLGVIVPLVNSRAEAAAAVAACKYPPAGGRSFGPIRAGLYGGRGYAQEANDEIACIAMIETEEGLANLEEIVTTPGLGGIYVGPADLSLALGLPPAADSEEPRHLEAVAAIVAMCKKHNMPVGIHTTGGAWSRKRLDAGFNFVTLGTDASLMMQAVMSELAIVRGAGKKSGEAKVY